RTSTPRTPVAKSPADVVLFDFGGTLDADGVHWSRRFHAAYRAVGGGLDFAAFDSFFKASDEGLTRLPGIRTLGFRAAIDAQAPPPQLRARAVHAAGPTAARVDGGRQLRGGHPRSRGPGPADVLARPIRPGAAGG